MDTWLSYWNMPNRSCVSKRHQRAHYDVLFAGVAPYLPDRRGVVLDWGCGDALAANRIAEQCSMVLLYDAAESARERLRQRYGSHDRIRILDKSGLEELARESIDFIVANSVIQYLSDQQLSDALALFHRLIKPGGTVLLGDVINRGTGNSRHVATFLGFAWKYDFLPSAIVGLARTFLSPYRSLQRDIGLAAFAPEQILDKLERRGFAAEKLPQNIAVSKHRSSYLARKPRDACQSSAIKPLAKHSRGAA
jgi:SAM-dependent methyltransferase